MASEVGQSITRLIRARQEGRGSATGPLLAAYFDHTGRFFELPDQPVRMSEPEA